MMASISKKKKQSINHELFVGGAAILLMLPLIVFAIGGTLLGTFVGISLLSQEVIASTALLLFMTYAFFTIVFGLIIWRIMQRIRLLSQRRHDLKAEQERVSHLMDMTSALDRLKDQDESSEGTLPLVTSVSGESSNRQVK